MVNRWLEGGFHVGESARDGDFCHCLRPAVFIPETATGSLDLSRAGSHQFLKVWARNRQDLPSKLMPLVMTKTGLVMSRRWPEAAIVWLPQCLCLERGQLVRA